MKLWKKFEEIVGGIMRGLSAACLGIVFVLFILNVVTRLPFIPYNPTWVDETIQFFLVWTIFLGAAELVRIHGHFVVDILTDKFHGTGMGRILAVLSNCLMLLTYAVIFYFGVRLCLNSNATMYTLPFMKRSYYYSCIPVSEFFMMLYAFRDLLLSIWDIATKGKVTQQLDMEKAANLEEDDDAKAISEAAEHLREDKNKQNG